jgi:hypothetical protein
MGLQMGMYNQAAEAANQAASNGMTAGLGLLQSSDWIANWGKKNKNLSNSNYGGTGMSFEDWRKKNGYVYNENGALTPYDAKNGGR